jgi:hypothetical protein
MATSKLQSEVSTILSTHLPDIDVKENYRPEWLITREGNRLELDFYIETLDLAIEVQGLQHYEYVPFFHGDVSGFEKRKTFDNFKREVCRQRNIALIEISDAEEITKVVGLLRELLLENSGRAPEAIKKKQVLAIATAWSQVKQTELFEQSKVVRAEIVHARRRIQKMMKEKEKSKGRKSLLALISRTHRKNTAKFREINETLYKSMVDGYINFMCNQ